MDKKAIARRSDALYYSGSDGINRRWLCDKVAELEHELERLREHETDAEHEESVAWDRVRKVERENAELRKLVRWMYDRMDESCAVHYPYAPEPISYRHLMRAEELMRELGIEAE